MNMTEAERIQGLEARLAQHEQALRLSQDQRLAALQRAAAAERVAYYARALVAEVDRKHDELRPPLRYTVPWRHVTELRDALNGGPDRVIMLSKFAADILLLVHTRGRYDELGWEIMAGATPDFSIPPGIYVAAWTELRAAFYGDQEKPNG